MDQTSFDFIKAAMIERVKAKPIYTYWKVPSRFGVPSNQKLPINNNNNNVAYGLLVAINLGSGFELFNLSEHEVTTTFKGITAGFTPFSSSPIGVPHGLVSDEILIELHKLLREREA